MLQQGHVYACLGLGLSFILASIGSTIAVGRAGKMSSALLSKDPTKFANFLVLQLLPATQSIYSFIVGFMGLVNMGIIGGTVNADFSVQQGLIVIFVCIPIGIVGLVSAIYQGAVGMAGMELCMKQEKQSGRAMTQAALVEMFAILSFVISLIAVMGITA